MFGIGLLLASTCWSRPASASGVTPTPSCWAWDITNFVWWIGIGHAGTLISAVLYLTRQNWRVSINRVRRGDDDLRRHVRRPVPAAPHRPSVVRVVDVPHPERHGLDVAAVPQPADVGRVRGLDVRHDVDPVLVHGHGPRPRDVPRSLRDRRARSSARCIYGVLVARLARLGPPVAPLRARVPDPRGSRDAAGVLGALGRVVRLRDVAAARLAHDDLPAVLRRRRHLLRLRDGAHAADAAAVPVQPASTSSSRSTSTRCARSCWRPA